MIAVGNRHAYNEVELDFTVSGSSSILLAIHDQRTEMISTGKPPEFVGYMRAGFGIPYMIATQSKQPFADDLAGTYKKRVHREGLSHHFIGNP
jgi:hypothetical protein